MTIRFILLLISVALFSRVEAQSVDKKLMKKLSEAVEGFNGEVGIYVRHLRSGKIATINADSLFPTASMIKIPITIGIFDKIEKGELDYASVMTYRDSLEYKGGGEDILGSMKDSSMISLAKALMLMITTSDNTASLWCQSLAGTGTAINTWLSNNGFHSTRVNSRTMGRESQYRLYGWGQTTPREMAELLVQIRQGKVVSPRASERIYRNLIRIYWDGEALSQIPPYVQAASKSGAVDRSKSEVVLVNAPHGDYVFCVITKYQEDERWTRDNEGYVLKRKVSRIIREHFEPKDNWAPSSGIEDWY